MVVCYKPTEYQATPDGFAEELVRKAAAACGPWIREPMEGEADSDLVRLEDRDSDALCPCDAREVRILTSSEVVVQAARVLVRKGEIHHTRIRFEHHWVSSDGQAGRTCIHADEDGRLAEWPNGFCEQFHQFLVELL